MRPSIVWTSLLSLFLAACGGVDDGGDPCASCEDHAGGMCCDTPWGTGSARGCTDTRQDPANCGERPGKILPLFLFSIFFLAH